MKVLKVEDMHCEKCVERITKAMESARLKFSVSLADKTVSVEKCDPCVEKEKKAAPDQEVSTDGCDSCVAKAKEILDDLGFDAVEM